MSISISMLKYADANNVVIDMFVDGVVAGQSIPFTYHPDDNSPVSVAVRELLAAGGQTIAPYAPPPAVPTPVPAAVTRRQMLLGLTNAGYITTAEAIAAAQNGAVPAAIQAVFDTLPDQASKDAAAITWASMSSCVRSDPLVAALAAAHSLTDAQVDDLFRNWITL